MIEASNQNTQDGLHNVLVKVYLEMVKDKKLVIAYKLIASAWLRNIQIELWNLGEILLIFRHSSFFKQKSMEFLPREQIEEAIELV